MLPFVSQTTSSADQDVVSAAQDFVAIEGFANLYPISHVYEAVNIVVVVALLTTTVACATIGGALHGTVRENNKKKIHSNFNGSNIVRSTQICSAHE